MKNAIICLLFLAAGSVVHAASFDCAKAATSIEKAICSDDQISGLDSQLMQSYKKSMATSANADALKLEQRSWLANVRNKCQDAACLKQVYADRIAQLDGEAKPLPVQATQNTPVAGVIDQPKANDAPPVVATSSEIAQPPAPPVAVPQSQKTEASSQVVTPAKPSPAVETPAATPSSTTNPGMGITDIFHVLFSLGMMALVVGMVRPSLAAKWIAVPTRKKIFGLMLIYLIPVAALSSFTETPERKAYEASLREQKEAEKVAKREERERKASPAQGSGSRYQNNVNRFVAVVHRAKKSGAMSRNPSCEAVVESAYGEYIGKMERDLQQARRDDPRADMGLLRAVTDTAASQLEMHISNIENSCNGQ